MGFVDLLIILSALIFGGLFILVGIQRIFNLYLGMVLGFFIFLSLNLELKIISLSEKQDLNGFDHFINIKPDFFLILSFFIIFISGIGYFLVTTKTPINLIVGSFYGLLLPFFIVGLIAFALKTSSLDLDFFSSLYGIFAQSVIFDFFYNHLSWFFILLLFLTFSKFTYLIGKIGFIFIVWFSNGVYNWFINKKESKTFEKNEEN